MNNDGLGARFNAGFQFAAEQGADYLVHIGSDDWIHPDVFAPLLAPLTPRPIIAGTQMAFVDLATGRLKRARMDGPHGVIPWIIPRELLEPCGFAPIRPERMRGMDGDLVRGLRRNRVRARWVFDDPHDLARVDFKSDVNINAYDGVPGTGRNDAWLALGEQYPAELVELAFRTSLKFQEDARCPS
jgi:glycosyltransferase involved in cell wall biosynthesis